MDTMLSRQAKALILDRLLSADPTLQLLLLDSARHARLLVQNDGMTRGSSEANGGEGSHFAVLDTFDPSWRTTYGADLKLMRITDDLIRDNQYFIVEYIKQQRAKQTVTPPVGIESQGSEAVPPPPRRVAKSYQLSLGRLMQITRHVMSQSDFQTSLNQCSIRDSPVTISHIGYLNGRPISVQFDASDFQKLRAGQLNPLCQNIDSFLNNFQAQFPNRTISLTVLTGSLSLSYIQDHMRARYVNDPSRYPGTYNMKIYGDEDPEREIAKSMVASRLEELRNS